MYRLKTITLNFAETERSLASLLGLDGDGAACHCESVAMQAPSGNSDDVMFGPCGAEAGFLAAGKSTMLPIHDLQQLFFLPAVDPTDTVIVHIF